MIESVRKKDLFTLIQPLLPKCHSLAMSLLPDDLQAQQLIVDSFTQCLLKEKSLWLDRDWDESDKKDQLHLRRLMLKSWIKVMVHLGMRRATQLQIRYEGVEQREFYQLDASTRVVAWLKYDQGWSISEIESTLGLKKFEVIEKVHNSRFILTGGLNRTQELQG
jgi:hypothetical protein